MQEISGILQKGDVIRGKQRDEMTNKRWEREGTKHILILDIPSETRAEFIRRLEGINPAMATEANERMHTGSTPRKNEATGEIVEVKESPFYGTIVTGTMEDSERIREATTDLRLSVRAEFAGRRKDYIWGALTVSGVVCPKGQRDIMWAIDPGFGISQMYEYKHSHIHTKNPDKMRDYNVEEAMVLDAIKHHPKVEEEKDEKRKKAIISRLAMDYVYGPNRFSHLVALRRESSQRAFAAIREAITKIAIGSYPRLSKDVAIPTIYIVDPKQSNGNGKLSLEQIHPEAASEPPGGGEILVEWDEEPEPWDFDNDIVVVEDSQASTVPRKRAKRRAIYPETTTVR